MERKGESEGGRDRGCKGKGEGGSERAIKGCAFVHKLGIPLLMIYYTLKKFSFPICVLIPSSEAEAGL